VAAPPLGPDSARRSAPPRARVKRTKSTKAARTPGVETVLQ
jgi:hypothetical protein